MNVSFGYLCQFYKLDYEKLTAIASQAKVELSVINALILSEPVKRVDVEAVLRVISEEYGRIWNLDNVSGIKLVEKEEEEA
jgi:hypothetical protein